MVENKVTFYDALTRSNFIKNFYKHKELMALSCALIETL